MTAIGLVCTLYSSLGGMKAVLATDVFQSGLMFAAVFSVIWCAAQDSGLAAVVETARDRGRLQFLELSPDPTVRHTLWSQVNIGQPKHDGNISC